MKLGTFALTWIGASLVLAGIIGAVLAAQIDCGYMATTDCYALKTQSWQLAAIPGLVGIGAIGAALAGTGTLSDPWTSNTPDAT